jgi:hypothetical protein
MLRDRQKCRKSFDLFFSCPASSGDVVPFRPVVIRKEIIDFLGELPMIIRYAAATMDTRYES